MESIQMGSILQKRSSGMTELQWIALLEELEKKGLFLVVQSSNPCLTKSPSGGFIPIPSKNDQFTLHSREELINKGLHVGHHILNQAEKLEKHPVYQARQHS